MSANLWSKFSQTQTQPEYFIAQDISGQKYLILIYRDNYLRLMNADSLVFHCYLRANPGQSQDGILHLNEELNLQLVFPPDPQLMEVIYGQ